MERMTYKKSAPAHERIITWPCTITRALDGGKTEKLLVDVKFKPAPQDDLSNEVAAASAINRSADLVVYDMTVKGFSNVPGADGIDDAELVAEFRKDIEVVKGAARGYYEMINGIVPKN